MNPQTIISSVDTLLAQHTDQLALSPIQYERARSLAVAGALSALIGTSARDLLTLLRPAFETLASRDEALLRDAVEGRR